MESSNMVARYRGQYLCLPKHCRQGTTLELWQMSNKKVVISFLGVFAAENV